MGKTVFSILYTLHLESQPNHILLMKVTTSKAITADRSLSDGWLVNLDNVPVAPPLTGQARLEYI